MNNCCAFNHKTNQQPVVQDMVLLFTHSRQPEIEVPLHTPQNMLNNPNRRHRLRGK